MKLAISSHSFHRLRAGPEVGRPVPDLLEIVERTATCGYDGPPAATRGSNGSACTSRAPSVSASTNSSVGRWVPAPGSQQQLPAFGDLNELKRRALGAGVQIVAVSAHHDFVTPDAGKHRRQLGTVHRWIGVVEALGAPVVRVLGGR